MQTEKIEMQGKDRMGNEMKGNLERKKTWNIRKGNEKMKGKRAGKERN